MNAIILAAGVGSRLGELTEAKPKALVRVNGRSILDRQLDALLAEDIDTIYVVVGYRGNEIAENIAARYPDETRVQCVENDDYRTTNNMYSLHLCAPMCKGRPFLLLNGDVVLQAPIIPSLMRYEGSAVCVDVGSYAEESMKVVVPEGSGHIAHISKAVPPEEALGCSIDVYRFSDADSDLLFEHTGRTIETEGRLTEWTEVALDELMRAGTLRMAPLDIEGATWYEIDSAADLAQAEAAFGRDAIPWDRLRIAFCDMDGTLYHGDRPIEGSDRFIASLRERVPHVYFLSNNSSRTHGEYVARLARCRIEASEDDIILSTDAQGAFLQSQGITRAYMVGTESMRTVLEDRYGVVHAADAPEAVILGFDTELTYEKLREAALLLQSDGMAYYATHMDLVCPTERGPIPDAGSVIALFEKATGRTPERIFGKPDPDMVRFLLERHGAGPDDAVFVGDRAYTDHAMARNCGSLFIGVLSGDATRADFEPCEEIVIFPSVASVFP